MTRPNLGGVKVDKPESWKGQDQIQARRSQGWPRAAWEELGVTGPFLLAISPPARIEALLTQGPGSVLLPGVNSEHRMPGTQ